MCRGKAPQTLSWISKQLAPSGVTSLSLGINNQTLPVAGTGKSMTPYTGLPICAHSPEETNTHTRHTTCAHTVMQSTWSISRNKPTVTVFYRGEPHLCGFTAESAHYGISGGRCGSLLLKSNRDNGSAKSDFYQVSHNKTQTQTQM